MASQPPGGPVTDTDILQAKERLKDLDIADQEIAKAERAGINMDEQKKQSAQLRIQLRQFLQTYAPGR